ncbi:SDR family NAD(P)-dependent oxidoreductase [Methylorubrum salsuginis]|uniref:Meso-butanediol dehydrogenase / (S,S)-butanediol dehydrogenase / diacetyl reductase n=1 Tax=Methylorubrum salsuginis TaxID=414703 RepID=A0A1I4K9A1_9HYPH|nr:SDR family oxidoreductase [Methylorubrum salsuginis]SFL75290.1 meso-butanediol dehydrogenase / (S,S)-butanediol dehydrogenase / diacetyl reductase [Methylorubrum salsuginis]
MARFSNKVVLVTGAASGIGEATARRFAQEGAQLVLADLNEKGLDRVAGEIGAEAVLTHATDLSNADRCEETIAATLARFGRLDVLVNNAGKDHLGRVDEGDLKDFSVVIETDLYGVFYMTRFALPHLRKSRGCIVNVSSVSGLGGDWNHSFYCAAKGAVTNFTRAVALDEAKAGVRVNAVNPSLVYTPFTAGMQDQPDLVAKFEERIPMGRAAQPEDITGVIAFLASEDARFVTGVNLPVDGGLSASNGQPALS